MKNVRSEGIDRLKGFAILLVIAGHCIQYSNGLSYFNREGFFDNRAYQMIYGFHMPLFMTISGYLFSKTIASRSIASVLWTRVRSLLVPVMLWGMIIYLLERKLLNHDKIPSDPVRLLKDYITTCAYSLWFLWAVFYCSIVAALVNKFLKNSWLAYLGICALLFFVPDEYNAYVYKFMFPYFVLPVVFRKSDLGKQLANATSRKKIVALVVGATAYGIAMIFWRKDLYIYTTHFTLLGRNWPLQTKIDLMRWATGFFGVVTALAAGSLVESRRSHSDGDSWLAILGRQSLGLYIVSGLIFSYVVLRAFASSSFSWIATLGVLIAVTASSLGITVVIQRFRPLNMLLLGGRK